jgi:hypothetical protein
MAFVRTCRVDTDASPVTMHELVADLTRHPEWAFNRLTVTHTGGPARGPGAHFSSEVRDVMPGARKPIAARIDVIDDQTHRVVYEAEDAAGRYRWTVTMAPMATGTRVAQTCERLRAPAFIPLIQPMMWRLLGRKQVQGGLDNLKRLAETAGAVPTQRPASELPVEVRTI